MNATEQLARWIVETYVAKCARRENSDVGDGWEGLSQKRQNEFLVVAAELLNNPPACLVEAIMPTPHVVESRWGWKP